jgi:hypothetical protein
MPLFNGDIIELTFWGRCFGQRILLTHHYRWEGTSNPAIPTSTSLTELLALVKDGGTSDIVSYYKSVLGLPYTYEFTRAQVIDPVRSAYVSDNADAGPALNPGTTNVGNQTLVLTFRTEGAGKKQRGNKHIGPIPVTGFTNGMIANAFVPLMDDLGSQMLKRITSATPPGEYAPIIYHGKNDNPGYTAITNYIIQTTARVQRRRTVGLGE